MIEIVVRGPLGPDLTAALGDYAVETGRTSTRIVGPIPDQSKLFGLLEMLDTMHIEVLSMNTIDDSA
jgi:hypothetical protein